MNSCYASIELLHHPELRGKPLAVGGDPEARHGIVLAKDQLAKKAGVQTGMALWQAKQVCPNITFLPPRMDLYLRFSKLAHEIYDEYTDQQEAFGIDESWLDVTGSCSCKGDGLTIAKEISNRVKYELGITVSIGVSWNKIFAKLGSDYKKPDAITVFNRDNYKELVWLQSAALGGHRCVSPAATLRSQRPPLLGGRFRFNHNSKMLRRPFQNGISRNLVIHNHRAPALRVSLRAGEGAKFHLAAFFQNLK